MNLIKILNVRNSSGVYDYRGLDLSKIIPGSQVYPKDENTAYFLYSGEIMHEESNDVLLVQEEEYEEKKNNFIQETMTEDPFVKLEQENKMIKQALSEQDELLMSMLLGRL